MKPISMFKKVSFYKLMLEQAVSQSVIEESVSKYPFKRCKENQLLSMGFKHPIDSTLEEAYSYAVGDWVILSIQIEEKSVSSSEVNYELHEIVSKIQKEEARKVNKEEKEEIKQSIYDEKAKTAPSSFTSVNLGLDNVGNLFINNTSSKVLDRVMELLMRAMKEYFNDYVGGFSSDFSIAATKVLRENEGEFPDEVCLSLGEKGEGKNGSKKISFAKITSDDKNILSMLKGYDLEITKLEIYYNHKDCSLISFVSNKGIESFSLSEELSDYLSEQSDDANTPEEAFDIELDISMNIIKEYLKEYFLFLKKVIPFSKADYNIIDSKYNETKELLDSVL